MNDTTYTASVLDSHRAADLRHELELRAQRAERDAAAAPRSAADHAATAVAASVLPPHRHAPLLWGRQRRSSFAATR